MCDGEFKQFCERNDIRCSRGRTGVWWDNAVAESSFATLKNEMHHQNVFTTHGRARFPVAEYIEIFYTRQRPHSALGYKTPAAARTKYESQTAAAA